jgi:hypothetical protein
MTLQLRLAEGIAQHDAAAALLRIAPPPGIHVVEYFLLRLPAVDRQSEGRFGDKAMAAYRLERRAGGVRLHLVVARGDPYLALVFHAYLGRAEHVSRRVQGKAHAVMLQDFSIRQALHGDVAQARAQDADTRRGAQVMRIAGPRMVAVAVRDHGALDRPPGVDVEAARHAVQPLLAHNHHVRHRQFSYCPESIAGGCLQLSQVPQRSMPAASSPK